MANVSGRGVVEAKIILEITEAEAHALDALACYGDDAFLAVFYTHLGRAYLQPYEAGLRSLLKSLRTGEGSVVDFLDRASKARKAFTEAGRE